MILDRRLQQQNVVAPYSSLVEQQKRVFPLLTFPLLKIPRPFFPSSRTRRFFLKKFQNRTVVLQAGVKLKEGVEGLGWTWTAVVSGERLFLLRFLA